MLLNNRIFKSLISCILVLALSLSVMLPAFAAEGDETTLSFREQTAQEALNDWMDAFLMEQAIPGSDEPGLTSRRWTNGNGRTDFWISAIVFDSFNDVLEYGTDEEYKAQIEEVMYQLYRGFYYAAQQQWGSTYETNTYNDDICWWAMVLERAYELTGKEEYFDLAKKCIDRVILDWDETPGFGGEPYGGILWRWSEALDITQNSKDTCANGNTSLTCARMARVCEEKGMTEEAAKYLDMAKKIYDWSEAHLIEDNGYVWNDVNYGGTRRNWQFTYCYGVSAGAAYELYKCTGEENYLNRAITIMQYGFDTRTQADGLTIVKEGDRGAGQNDDADAFKNIMLRIAAQMYHEGAAPQFEKYLNANAQQAYKNRRFSDGLINRNLAVMPSASEPCNSPCAIMAPSLLYWATLENEEDYPERVDPYAPVEGRYEAELAEASNVAFQADDTASGGQTVQYWDADSAHIATGYLNFNVEVETAGEYNINLVWKSRNQNGTRHIQVNDGPDEIFTFPQAENNTWQTTTITANLNKGENTIKVSYWNNDLHEGEKDTQSWWFLDYIQLEKLSSNTAAAEEMMDDFLATYLRPHYNKEGEQVGQSTYRWSDQYFEGNNEPRETDFWLSAILFDSFNDALEYGDDEAYKEKIEEIMYDLYLSFAKSQNHPTWDVDTWEINTYNDDLCWWAMALERAYELTGVEEYLTLAEQCISRVLLDYDTTDAFGGAPLGGILWRWSEALATNGNSKDMCANGNTSLVCSRFAMLYAEKGDEEKAASYAEYAKNTYDWLIAHLYVEGGNGRVNNSINYDGSVNTSQFTYNYGVCAGAAYELYNLTGEQEYLDTAIEVMQYGFDTLTSDGLTIADEGTGDGSGFKNIMLRIAADMCYQGGVEQFDKYITANAYQAWNHRREADGLVGSNLRFTPLDEERLCSPCAILGPSLLYWCQFDPEAEYDFDFSGNDVEGRYEAELARSSNMTYTSSQGGATPQSGKSFTWYWNPNNNVDGWIEFEVEVPAAGKYNLDVSWYTRGNNNRRMSVNGGESVLINFNRQANNVWEIETFEVDLVEGLNKIRISYPVPRDGGSDPWLFIDYIEVKQAVFEPSVSTEKTEYETDDDITFTITTEGDVVNVGLVNENGKYLGKTSQTSSVNEDGTITWTITTSVSTKGEREISIYTDNGSGQMVDTGIKANIVIEEAKPDTTGEAALNTVALDKAEVVKNEAITATIVTSTGVSKVGIFNESGKAMGKLSESYVDEGDVRTWTVTFAIGSRGTRELGIRYADGNGVWSQATPITVIVK